MRFVLGLALVSVGCGGGSPAGDGGAPDMTQALGNEIRATLTGMGANNVVASYQSLGLSAGWNQNAIPEGTSEIMTANQPATARPGIDIRFAGKPAMGTSIMLRAMEFNGLPPGGYGYLAYHEEDGNGTRTWVSTGGTLKIDVVAGKDVKFSFTGVPLGPAAGAPNNRATGTLMATGMGHVMTFSGL